MNKFEIDLDVLPEECTIIVHKTKDRDYHHSTLALNAKLCNVLYNRNVQIYGPDGVYYSGQCMLEGCNSVLTKK